MKNRNLILLSAMAALILASLACSFGGEPGVSDIYMAKDVDGDVQTSVFSPADDFYVFFDVNAADTGTYFEGRWFALDIEGEDPNTAFKTIGYNLEDGVRTVYFQLFNDEEWPVGTYRVDIYMEGTKVGEHQFSVQ
ncbi:MAG TPA: hypothetical protein VK851_07130 [Anaerolineales bacterium]|nr:hypothetical protein [Anaerolineales bacterium]